MKKWYRVQFDAYLDTKVIKSLNPMKGKGSPVDLITKAEYIDNLTVRENEQKTT